MSDAVTIRIAQSFADVPAARWNVLSGAAKEHPDGVYNPFLSHAYLSALEESGSATAKTGWLGQHLLLEGSDGHLRAASSAI